MTDEIERDGETHFAEFCGDMAMERARQDEQWGGEDHDDEHDDYIWLAIVIRQLGHAGRDIEHAHEEHARLGTYLKKDRVYRQVVQVAAVCAAWGEAILREGDPP